MRKPYKVPTTIANRIKGKNEKRCHSPMLRKEYGEKIPYSRSPVHHLLPKKISKTLVAAGGNS